MVSSLLALSLAAAAPDVVPAKLIGPYFQVPVIINGHKLSFLVDTGAGATVLTPKAAEACGITGGIPVQAGGAGPKSTPARMVTLDTMTVGQSTLKGISGVVLELPAALKTDGLVGYTFLREFVTTLDYTKPCLTFAQPADFHPDPKDRETELTIRSGHPVLKGSVNGIEGPLVIDSGAGGLLTLQSPFVEANQLRSKLKLGPNRIIGKGTGGYVRGEMTRVDSLTVGGVTFSNVPTGLASADGGAMSNSSVIANVGADILRQIILTLDYKNKKAYVRKSSAYGDPFYADRAGLFPDLQEGRLVVADVVKGTPAEEAGLQVGDEILAINGKPVGSVHPLELRRELRGKPGAKIRLQLQRSGKKLDIVLTLRDL